MHGHILFLFVTSLYTILLIIDSLVLALLVLLLLPALVPGLGQSFGLHG